MAAAFLDINDCNLRLWHTDQQVESPGYALLDGRDYRFGRPARAEARLQPRKINTRFWWQLSTEPLQPALGPARHTADLVHAHLQALHREAGEPAELLVAASAGMQRDQLSLLLGIAQQCPFEIVGLVNRSTLLASQAGGSGRIFHLEVQLHQALLCELAVSGRDVSVQRSVPLPGCGLLQVQERMVVALSDNFVRQTRFDPRRKAGTEQALYDALPGALAALGTGTETNVEVNGYRARVSRDDLAETSGRLFDAAAQAMGSLEAGDTLIGDPLLGLLPGFQARLPQLQICTGVATWEAAQAHGDELLARGQPLSFRGVLPCLQPGIAAPIEPAFIPPAPVGPQPTHLLRGATAIALGADGLDLGDGARIHRSGEQWLASGMGLTHNGQPFDGEQPLAAGDVLTADGEEIRLIEVVS